MLEKIYLKQTCMEALQAYLKDDDIQGMLAIIHDNSDLYLLFETFQIILKKPRLLLHDEELHNLIQESLKKNEDMI